MARLPIVLTLSFCGLLAAAPRLLSQEMSHPPLRREPPPSERPLAAGPAYYVDAARGDDANPGAEEQPWRTLGHALAHLSAGDTLYLRGGVYYEHPRISLLGSHDAPITIRGYPGERAVIDGGLREFFQTPEACWEPHAGSGAEGEYRSTRRYGNLRNVIGSFGDSMIGLQTYYYAKDLRSRNGRVDWQDWERRDETDLEPLYCGPGIWYDRRSGYLHARLAPTHLPAPVANYRGPRDPRRLPLILAPFDAVALTLDRAEHVRLQDLTVRGGGYTTVVLDHAVDVEMDNVTVWCGTYGMRATRTGPFRFVNSALYGNAAPWTFRNDTSKRDYPGRPHRNITRLNTHALLELEAGGESSVYATPQNDNWEFAYSEFTDAHDGLYLGAVNVRFHHNLVDNMQDDGIYLSPMYYRYRLLPEDPQLHVYQNYFGRCLTALAFGGPVPATRDRVFVYRNVFDLRGRVNTGRPTAQRAEPGLTSGNLLGDHGSPPWSKMAIYQNTFVMARPARGAGMNAHTHTSEERPREVFNNIFLHLARLPGLRPPNPAHGVQSDGNLYWSPGTEPEQAARFFDRFRNSELYAQSKQLYAPGSTTHSQVAKPQFRKALADPAEVNDYRLQSGSPAADAGVELPSSWPDPLREADARRPDIGALPLGSEMFPVGRHRGR